MANYITVNEAAEILGVGRVRVNQMIHEGKFKHIGKFGRSWALDADEVESFKMSADRTVKNSRGSLVDYNQARRQMDAELKGIIRAAVSPCTAQVFFTAYAKAHKAKFGKPFAPDTW